MSDGSQHTGQQVAQVAGAAATGFAFGGPVGAVTLSLVSLATGIIGRKAERRARRRLRRVRREQAQIVGERFTEEQQRFAREFPLAERALETTLRERGITRGATADVARERLSRDIQLRRAEFGRRARELSLGIEVPRIEERFARTQRRLGVIRDVGGVAALLADPRIRTALGGFFGGGAAGITGFAPSGTQQALEGFFGQPQPFAGPPAPVPFAGPPAPQAPVSGLIQQGTTPAFRQVDPVFVPKLRRPFAEALGGGSPERIFPF